MELTWPANEAGDALGYFDFSRKNPGFLNQAISTSKSV
jgi:hypothetical protein